MTTRVMPPSGPTTGVNPITVASGQTYSCAVGSTLDVPDHHAAFLEVNGWHTAGQVNVTAGRPTTGISKGKRFVDTTLGYEIVYDGTQWRNPVTGAVV